MNHSRSRDHFPYPISNDRLSRLVFEDLNSNHEIPRNADLNEDESALSHLLQTYPYVLENRRIADLLIDPSSGITPAIVLDSIRERRGRRASCGGGRIMATTAKHTRDKFDAGEEDIAAIAKQISDHAEAIYQTWKSRGLAPTEILNCHTPQTAVDKFGSALSPQKAVSVQDSPVSELLAGTPDMDNNNLEKLVNNFVSKDKARIAAQQNKSPTKPVPSSIQYALQKFEKNLSPQNPTSPSSNALFGAKSNVKLSPVKTSPTAQTSQSYPNKPAISVKPQVAPKSFNLPHADNRESDTIGKTFPPDIVPQKPETPKRPSGLTLQTPPNMQTWPLKNKIFDHKQQKQSAQNDQGELKAAEAKSPNRGDKFSTLPNNVKSSTSTYLEEVAREEERLINALKTGVVLSEDADSVSLLSKATTPSKKESSPGRQTSVKPDLIPAEKSKDERDGSPNVSLVDYAKSKYRDNLEHPLTQQRLDANKRLDMDRKALMVDPSLGLQVTETRNKFENAVEKINGEKSDKEVGNAAPPGRWGNSRGMSSRRADQVPHPELTSQQKQHIRAQADKVAGSPVRPFLTRGSVAERVLIFEKCPSELMLDKRKAPAIASWRTGHDVMAKAQTYGANKSGTTAVVPHVPSSTAAAIRKPSQNAATTPTGHKRAPIPKFYFPSGKPPPQSAIDQAILRVQSAFNTFPNSQVPRESFHHIVKACDCPLYWKAPIFLATQRNLHSSVDGHKFIDYWRQLITQCHDPASRFVYLLTKGASNYLGPEDLVPLVQDVVDSHPGLSFLKEATEFHSRYVHTVIARIFYCVNRSWSGKISLVELRKSNLLQVIQLLEEEEDINQVTAYFSYEHFYVIYCKFWELDRDHDLFIDKQDLARHNEHALSSRMIDRVVSGCVTRGTRRAAPGEEPRMSYTEFVWFLLAEEDKTHPTAIEYWFRCMDLDGDGYLSMYELEYFYEEQMHRMENIGIETLPFQDCLCQMLDMVRPKERDKVSLSDLKKCKMTPIFFDTFFNLEKYLDHEQRDPFASQRDHDADGHELSEWDRFAAEEYELLVAEEGGSDAQDQISYDETDDDCLSPLDEILSAQIVEDSDINPSTDTDVNRLWKVGKSSPTSPKIGSTNTQDAVRNYINPSSHYYNSLFDKVNFSKLDEKSPKNGYNMNHGPPATNSQNNINASFLYSHLLSPSSNKSYSTTSSENRLPSNTTNGGDSQSDEKSSPTLGSNSFAKLSFTGGINKISGNYEKAILESQISQKDLSAMNRLGIFNKEKKLKLKTDDDEDDDYARDSDECSI